MRICDDLTGSSLLKQTFALGQWAIVSVRPAPHVASISPGKPAPRRQAAGSYVTPT